MHLSIGKLATLSISLLIGVTMITTGAGLYVLQKHRGALERHHAIEAGDRVQNAALALRDRVRLREDTPQLLPPYPQIADGRESDETAGRVQAAQQVLEGMLRSGDRFVLTDNQGTEILAVGNTAGTPPGETHRAPVPDTAWTLVLYRPGPQADTPLLGLAIFYTLILLAVGLLAVAMIRVILARLHADLLQLDAGLDDVLLGRYRTPATTPVTEEIGALLPRMEQLAQKLRQQHDKLENHSLSDPLTGLFNRRYFDLMLAHLHEQSERQLPATLAVINLNEFNQVNEQFGREDGDRILQNTACYLLSRVRATDIVVRLGGDEFGLLLTNMAGAMLEDWLAALVHDYDHQALENGDSNGKLFCQFSIGVAQIDAQIYPVPTAVFNAAHGAMYTAKQRRQVRHSRYAVARSENVTSLTPVQEAL